MLPKGYQKRSFLRFDANIKQDLILKEYKSIPDDSWASSYWGNIHCSIGMLLLRGGTDGNEEDFYSDIINDLPLLRQLPYIQYLISKDGPFGIVEYAFILKMEAKGVSLKHVDLIEKWKGLYRVHIPIITNSGAYLISEGKSLHFSKGYAWTFDNQAEHGVVNGDEERVHLIVDVRYNEKIKSLIDSATLFEGEKIECHINKINSNKKVIASYPGDNYIRNEISKLLASGFSNYAISELFNARGVPTKNYNIKKWQDKLIDKYIQ